MTKNEYLPFSSKILEVIKHTDIEYTFRMAFRGDVKPGHFFEVSIPKYGEAPISVSGIGDGHIDLTIRRVGKVTNEVFEHYAGDTLMIRGPYGNGFDIEDYRGKELVIVAGGTGISPVRGIISYFAEHDDARADMTLIAGFRSADDILFRDDLAFWRTKMNVILTLDRGEETSDHKIGLVTQHIPNVAVKDVDTVAAIVVGPPAMMQFSVKALLERGFREENIWISHERKMCCGLGKCGHCKLGDAYVCLDGPVFRYKKGKTLID